MNKLLAILIPVTALFLFGGCDDDDDRILIEDAVPAAPQEVFSITGDGWVDIFWNGPYEADIVEYGIYRSTEATTGYRLIGTKPAEANPNLDLIYYSFRDESPVNGNTYFYAVTSVDEAQQESELSAEDVYDTPRPEGLDELFSLFVQPLQSGYVLATRQKVPYDAMLADIYIDTAGGVFYLNAANFNTDLQDVGYTASWEEAGYAPDAGWSQLGYVEVIPGHTYIIWTDDDHFAKIRILTASLGTGRITFQWAYQESLSELGQRELSPGRPMQKPSHGPDYLKRPPLSTEVL